MAIRTLLFLALEGQGVPLSPRLLARSLNCSPTYVAKTTRLLVRAGVLRSVRGVNGGGLLAKTPHEATLLEVIEACEGPLAASYRRTFQHSPVCSFHEAMRDLHEQTVSVLSEWTLERLIQRPANCRTSQDLDSTRMLFEGCEKYDSALGSPEEAAS